VGAELFEKILSVASGEKTKSELAGVGEEEFAPWQIGPTL
jgi:altronate hydrolase